MNPEDLSKDDLQLVIRALSIHRAHTRRKLDKLRGPAYDKSLAEVRHTQALIKRLQDFDLNHIDDCA